MIVESLIPVETDAPIGWLGGKTKLRPTIINCMPPHHCYVEVFGGSATVFFGKPASLSRIEVINDIHEDLVNLMKVIAGTCFDESVRQEFIGYVRNMPAARAATRENRALLAPCRHRAAGHAASNDDCVEHIRRVRRR